MRQTEDRHPHIEAIWIPGCFARLAMTNYSLAVYLARGESPARTKSIIWSIDGPGLVAHCAIICG